MAVEDDRTAQVRAYLEYFRDMGVHDFYRGGDGVALETQAVEEAVPVALSAPPVSVVASLTPMELNIAKLISFNDLAPMPATRVAAAERVAALAAIQKEIGDCTRCPLAYAGRHTIVFGQGDPNARLMFVGEGPGADEDVQGLPFVGKSGQLLNNMIVAMGLRREDVYIANVVKCRPPANRAPEPVEANTCTQFLVRQMDVVQPEVVVALGATAAMYLLGVKQSLASLRGRFHPVRGAKCAITYHPAFLLRDPTKKGEAWKDLQMVMKEMGLKAGSRG
jgi:DNA polymerase